MALFTAVEIQRWAKAITDVFDLLKNIFSGLEQGCLMLRQPLNRYDLGASGARAGVVRLSWLRRRYVAAYQQATAKAIKQYSKQSLSYHLNPLILSRVAGDDAHLCHKNCPACFHFRFMWSPPRP